VVVLAGRGPLTDHGPRALAESLEKAGIETIYIGHEQSPGRIARIAAAEGADAVEVCLAGGGGADILRGLLRELSRIDRREISIVPHRVD
jgi:methylmalonyl-CoA mutase cobalamin-binding subunit